MDVPKVTREEPTVQDSRSKGRTRSALDGRGGQVSTWLGLQHMGSHCDLEPWK